MIIGNKIVWTEIPVAELKRATNFYSKLMNFELTTKTCDSIEMSICPHKDGESGFCLVTEQNFKPFQANEKGPLIYLNVNGRLDEALSEVQKHGGKIILPKESMDECGFRAIILDSEGNRIGLHSY